MFEANTNLAWCLLCRKLVRKKCKCCRKQFLLNKSINLVFTVCHSILFLSSQTRVREEMHDLDCSLSFYVLRLKALCQADNLNKLPAGVDFPHHVIRLYPPLMVHNKLPFELVLSPQVSKLHLLFCCV